MILIVDDTPTNIQVLAENLVKDFRIKVAANGEAALEAVATQELPDLILLDVMMPKMDGYEVCRRLKDNPLTAAIPVVFVTAISNSNQEEYGLNLGALDYITKPFYLPVVKARIRNLIRLKQMTDMLESLAWIDGLTGIANRRRFEQVLEKEWKRAQRHLHFLTVVMIDVDYFKAYNDHFGHGSGDECLKRVAFLLRSNVNRAGDLVARYGGEEFVVLMPETDLEGARQIAEQLCRIIEHDQIRHACDSVSNWVTISAGYASLVPSLQQESSHLVDIADRMLYRAKTSGRNCAYGALSERSKPSQEII